MYKTQAKFLTFRNFARVLLNKFYSVGTISLEAYTGDYDRMELRSSFVFCQIRR